jgi:hypothetical protein
VLKSSHSQLIESEEVILWVLYIYINYAGCTGSSDSYVLYIVTVVELFNFNRDKM